MKFVSNKICRKILTGFLIAVFSMSTISGRTIKTAADFSAKQPKDIALRAIFAPDKKFALVIGNSEYESSPLRNPANDAQIIASSLSKIGFQTTLRENLSLAEMQFAIQDFTKQLPKGSVSLFYFAGHGIQIEGRNFLIPIDFNPSQTEVAKQAVDVESVINAVAGKTVLNILILDACRNAPKGFSVSANKKGLAEIKNAPIGTYIAFSTAPGKTAKDGAGDNSPYSQSLADNLRLRPSRLEDVFIRTRIQTDNLTGGEQTPWESSSLRTVFHFTEDTFAETSDVVFKPPIVKNSGSLFSLPVVVPILNESGRQINTLPQTASYFVENDLDLKMMQIRGGKFAMGTSWQEVEAAYKNAQKYKSRTNKDEDEAEEDEDETDRELKSIPAEMPQHLVNVPGFFISKYEITQTQWQAVMGNLPSIPQKFRGADLPVVNVSWRQADEFCQKLSMKTGKNYRLPTEAEWEYAARAGTNSAFAFGKTINSSLVNYRGNAPFLAAASGVFRNALVSVGSLGSLNGFGLADMHGNVWEWTADNWHDNYNDAPTDGGVWEADAPDDEEEDDPRLFRVIRGGSWDSTASSCRSSHRRRFPQVIRSTKIGFRVVMG